MKKFINILFLMGVLTFGTQCLAFENIIIDEDIQPNTVETAKKEDAKVLEAGIVFDWLDITQAQRDEQIEKYKNFLFESDKNSVYHTKESFKSEFAKYFKDKDYKHHYMMTNNGVTEDEDAKYCAFYYKKNTLVMYAIQYKDNPHNSFYYTAFGKLYYVDITSSDYPNFPYYSMQYDRKGNLKSAIYFLSHDMQYMFGPNKEFQGLWYKDKMYSSKGKQTLTRTNW